MSYTQANVSLSKKPALVIGTSGFSPLRIKPLSYQVNKFKKINKSTMIGWEIRIDSSREKYKDCNHRMDMSGPKLQKRGEKNIAGLLKKLFDACGFPVITSSLRFTHSESKCQGKPCRHCLGAASLKLNDLPGYDDVLSPGLRIHDRRYRGRRSDLLQFPNIM